MSTATPPSVRSLPVISKRVWAPISSRSLQPRISSCPVKRRPLSSIQPSLVNAGVMAPPDGNGEVVAFVARGDAVKLRHLRARSRAAITFRSGWEWVAVEGPTVIVGPDDPPGGADPEQLRLLLRDVFRAAGGTHDDWDEYDRVMLEDGRAAVFVSPERITSN